MASYQLGRTCANDFYSLIEKPENRIFANLEAVINVMPGPLQM